MEIQYRRPDGSFVALVNGLPYHVVDGDSLYAEAAEFGADLPFEPQPESSPVTLDDYRFAIQATVDTVAQERSYDSGLTCSSYLGSTNSGWAAEAAAFVAWRDAVWAYAYAELAKVEAGEREQPELAELIGELPAINWPD